MRAIGALMPLTTGAPAAAIPAAAATAGGRAPRAYAPTVEPMAVVTARGLVRTFGEGRAARRVLDGADVDVEAGEIVAVLGRSGSGKSTLLHVLGGLDRPEAGVVEVAGRRVTGAGERRLSALRRRHIGFVFQFFHLLPELTGEANVLLAGRVRGADPDALGARPGAGRPARAAPRRRTRSRTSSPAASSSASRSPARWSTTRRCCSRTSRPATSTSRPAPTCSRCCASSPARAARSCSSRTRRTRRRSPTACCGSRTDGSVPHKEGQSRFRLRVARGRTVLAALGIFAASLVVGTAATVGYGLVDRLRPRRAPGRPAGRDRPLRPRGPRARVDERVRALPNLAARSYRHEEKNVEPARERPRHAQGRAAHRASAGGAATRSPAGATCAGPTRWWSSAGWRASGGSRRATAWRVFGGWEVRVVGVAIEPDNVAFPLTVTPRVYTSEASWDHPVSVNLALLWLVDPDRADITLTQARATSFGIGNLAFITRAGIEVLLGQAAGIVIALLVAFSLVALVAAGTMLAAGAHAEVQRRLPSFGVRRALGFTPGAARRRAGGRGGAAVAAPAAALGLAAGALVVSGPSAALLAQLNEQPPGAALLPVLGACLLAITARRDGRGDLAGVASGAPPAGRDPARRGPRARSSGGAGARGAACSRPARGSRSPRAAATRPSVATIAVCAGVVCADARARRAARAAARRPRHDRQALPAHRPPQPVRRRRGQGDPGRRRRRRALPGRRRRLVPPRRAAADDRLPRRPHALRGAAARRGAAAARRRRGRGRRRARRRARTASRRDVRRADAGRRRGALPCRRDRARARARRPDRVRAAGPAARRAAGASTRRSPCGSRPARTGRRSSASWRRSARRRSRSGPPRRATRRSSACWRPCCAASGSPSASSACTRWSRRSR